MQKPGEVRSSTYSDFGKENNNKSSKFEMVDHVRRGSFLEFAVCSCVQILWGG